MAELEKSGRAIYSVEAARLNETGSQAICKQATLTIDTSMPGRLDAFNPAELLLASVAACMLKSIERVAPLLHFSFRGVSIRVQGIRQDKPPRITEINYEISINTDEPEHRLELLHQNIRKYGTISNTVAAACSLNGNIQRA